MSRLILCFSRGSLELEGEAGWLVEAQVSQVASMTLFFMTLGARETALKEFKFIGVT